MSPFKSIEGIWLAGKKLGAGYNILGSGMCAASQACNDISPFYFERLILDGLVFCLYASEQWPVVLQSPFMIGEHKL